MSEISLPPLNRVYELLLKRLDVYGQINAEDERYSTDFKFGFSSGLELFKKQVLELFSKYDERTDTVLIKKDSVVHLKFKAFELLEAFKYYPEANAILSDIILNLNKGHTQ